MNPCNENTHTDRIDVTFDIALYEYGIVRNPKNNDTVFCLTTTNDFLDDDDDDHEYSNYDISFDDVLDALKEAGKGYFSFIGSDLDTELKALDNNHLAIHIYSLNQYNGCFAPSIY